MAMSPDNLTMVPTITINSGVQLFGQYINSNYSHFKAYSTFAVEMNWVNVYQSSMNQVELYILAQIQQN
jgi:hypothetical protein